MSADLSEPATAALHPRRLFDSEIPRKDSIPHSEDPLLYQLDAPLDTVCVRHVRSRSSEHEVIAPIFE